MTDKEIVDLLAGSPDNGVTESMFDALGATKAQLLRLYVDGKIEMGTRTLAKPASTVVTYYPMRKAWRRSGGNPPNPSRRPPPTAMPRPPYDGRG